MHRNFKQPHPPLQKVLTLRGKVNTSLAGQREEKITHKDLLLSFSKYTSKTNKNILENGKGWNPRKKNVRHVRSNTMIY